jgi:hypothetical protein
MNRRTIRLSRAAVAARLAEDADRRSPRWRLAVDPATDVARIVEQLPNGFVPDAEGHWDLFPLSMAVEREDGFIEGGDWLVATTRDPQAHDGLYRSYWVEWDE